MFISPYNEEEKRKLRLQAENDPVSIFELIRNANGLPYSMSRVLRNLDKELEYARFKVDGVLEDFASFDLTKPITIKVADIFEIDIRGYGLLSQNESKWNFNKEELSDKIDNKVMQKAANYLLDIIFSSFETFDYLVELDSKNLISFNRSDNSRYIIHEVCCSPSIIYLVKELKEENRNYKDLVSKVTTLLEKPYSYVNFDKETKEDFDKLETYALRINIRLGDLGRMLKDDEHICDLKALELKEGTQ